MTDTLSERLDAVERRLTDGATLAECADATDAADVDERLSALEAQASAIDERVTELEAATQAVRGYVGGVRAINRDVERRADAALAGVEALAEQVGETPDDETFEVVCADVRERNVVGVDDESGDDKENEKADENGANNANNANSANDGTTDLLERLRDVV
ncbi:hypothetical protein SAMN04487950_2016 [Halogranum rubrum]|uniref:DUF7310 domain-containing protein n=1 Tax=Halogranum rubrum TaxID=553466 RepID=A0A1I4E9P4_9EURY|nr:hypothetical protein [Halogranum rubrum]SFL02475.1 hypothetical protein SAMN04487950_2016 [Halogranum rubrum]